MLSWSDAQRASVGANDGLSLLTCGRVAVVFRLGHRWGQLDVDRLRCRARAVAQRQRNDANDIFVGAVDDKGKLELVAELPHEAQSLLVVWTPRRTQIVTLPSRSLASNSSGFHDALECLGDVSEVGDAASNDENFPLGSTVSVMSPKSVRAYSYVCSSDGAPEYSP